MTTASTVQSAVYEVPVLIPAYKPGAPLAAFVEELLRRRLQPIVIVNDGSGPEFASLFQSLRQAGRVFVIDHPVNLGKGAALKTGMDFARTHFPGSMGVVTADADGQHDPEDTARVIAKLRENPDALVMGVRQFGNGAARVPWKSRIGNGATRVCMALLAGQKLTDTQTGLRGIPATLIPHLLAIPSQRYEFELDMLMACKHNACRIVEEPIQTIYTDGNQGSHFRPFVDSMRIYFQLLRFSLLSAATALLDNLIFILAFTNTGSVALSQAAGRLCAMSFNYWGARGAVFHSHQAHRKVLPKYVALVAVNGMLSYALILWLHAHLGMREIAAKLSAESFLFLVNFIVQRDFVFTRSKASIHTTGAATGAVTDWDRYYSSVPATAKVTRKYTTKVLLDAIQKYTSPGTGEPGLSIVEIGGANSCFIDSILAKFPRAAYHVVDTNSFGLSLLKPKQEQNPAIHLHLQDVLALSLTEKADLVYSVGLIEHFDPANTRRAIRAHFEALRPGGTAIITFPTPTLLYRTARRLLEIGGLWKFPDERPLQFREVREGLVGCGDVLHTKILWPLILTQGFIVVRKPVNP